MAVFGLKNAAIVSKLDLLSKGILKTDRQTMRSYPDQVWIK
jgi:hypothetical protein